MHERARRPGGRRTPRPILGLVAGLLTVCGSCATSPPAPSVAARNAANLRVLPIDLFGRPETGWAVYAPKVGWTLGTSAGVDSAAFAAAVVRWRLAHGLSGAGDVDDALLQAMKHVWQAQRPFVRARAAGVCPAPPAPEALGEVAAQDSYAGRPLLARLGALDAYRRMVQAARGETPALAARPELLQIFSAYRSPEWDAARCATERNCQGVVRAACSAHRTGLALDLVLDTAPGFPVDSSADANRLEMVRGRAYRWMLANAGRYGFVNYVFEPWHWEWTGEAP